MIKKILIVFVIVIAGIFLAYEVLGQKSLPQSVRESVTNVVPTIAALLPEFNEMTIPYLRNRSYTSVLGSRTKLSQTGTYTSYLTSYTSDGNKINALLTEPTGTPPAGGWPAIVFVHGYIPPTQYQTTERYVAYVDYLARNGFVVLKIDLRGHGSSEGTPSGAYYSSGYVIDTLNAYAALQKSSFVNPALIGLWGHSMAGNIVSRVFSVKPEIRAVVIWAGAGYTYTDLQQYGLHDASYRSPQSVASQSGTRRRIAELFGAPGTDNVFWKNVAPSNFINDWKGAIEVHHAVDDDVVSVEYSRNLKKMLDQTQVPHEFYEYPSGGHNITDPSFGPAMSRTVEFYKKYLSGK